MRSVSTTDAELHFAASPEAAEYRDLAGVAYTIKNIVDRVSAAVILIVLAGPMLVIAVLVKLSSPGPVLVRQVRGGRFGRPFTFYKVRWMSEDAEQSRDAVACQI